MATPRCEHCDGPMPLLSRPSLARFCSGRCRTAAHRARRRLPTEMTRRDRWVRRTPRKVPITCDGKAASSTDPATWCSYRDAVRSRAGVGLGFVLAGDGIACVDLDHCLIEGRVAPWAQAILDRFPATYVEVSPSGDGLHVFGLAEVGRGRRLRVDGGQVEVYDRGRYMTVTRERFGGCPAVLADISEAVASLL